MNDFNLDNRLHYRDQLDPEESNTFQKCSFISNKQTEMHQFRNKWLVYFRLIGPIRTLSYHLNIPEMGFVLAAINIKSSLMGTNLIQLSYYSTFALCYHIVLCSILLKGIQARNKPCAVTQKESSKAASLGLFHIDVKLKHYMYLLTTLSKVVNAHFTI